MSRSPYQGHRFPPVVIQHVVWLYLRFTLSLRDVEDMLAEQGLDLSYETVRRWVCKFGPLFARDLRRRRPSPTARWHLRCSPDAYSPAAVKLSNSPVSDWALLGRWSIMPDVRTYALADAQVVTPASCGVDNGLNSGRRHRRPVNEVPRCRCL